MSHRKASSSLLLLAIFLVCSSTITTALNITRILSNYPDFGTFSDLINRTGINDLVKNRQSITLLALDNDTIGSISGRPQDEIKRILMAHIVLDYYDTLKIQKLGKRSVLLTNLYQTTGVAQDQQGFLNMTKLGPGNVVFGSAVHGSALVAKLLGSVLAQPFNISVLHVSTPIVPAGIGEVVLAPPPPPFFPPPPAPKKAEAPSSNDGADDSDEVLVPAPSPADAPVADAPTMSNHKSPPSPTDADAQPPAPSGSRSVGSGIVYAAMMGLVASLVVF